MTRELQIAGTGTELGQWFRDNLRDSKTGLNIQNIDMMLYAFYDKGDKKSILMLIEEKTHSGKPRPAQRDVINALKKLLKNGARVTDGIDFWGYHILILTNTTPDNGTVRFDGDDIDAEKLRRYLNLEEKPPYAL